MRSSRLLPACALALALALVAPAARAELDSFLCYKAKTPASADPFEPVEVALADASGTRNTRVEKPKAVCSPTLVGDPSGFPGGAAVSDAVTHLAGYQASDQDPQELPAPVCVANALDASLQLEPKRPPRTRRGAIDRLLVPSSVKAGAAPPVLPANEVDAFACYRAGVADGAPLPRRVRLVHDQLGPERKLDVRKPKHLCLPVAVAVAAEADPAAIHAPDAMLVCYGVKPAKGSAGATPFTALHVGNLLGDDQTLDAKKRTVAVSTGHASGSLRGDSVAPEAAAGDARPGDWSDLDATPSFSGGGPLGDGEVLVASFAATDSLPEGEVERWRVFVAVDITENETDLRAGVAMTTTGVPGIPDDLELEAMASGTPRGIRLSSAWYEPPAGTALSSLEGATMTFQPRAFGPEAFGFDLKDWGIEYDLATTSGGSEAGPAEEELCVPSAPCEALRAD